MVKRISAIECHGVRIHQFRDEHPSWPINSLYVAALFDQRTNFPLPRALNVLYLGYEEQLHSHRYWLCFPSPSRNRKNGDNVFILLFYFMAK